MRVHYHPGKANVVADALSIRSMGSVANVEEERKELALQQIHLLETNNIVIRNSHFITKRIF